MRTVSGRGLGKGTVSDHSTCVVYLPGGSDGGPDVEQFGNGIIDCPPGEIQPEYVVTIGMEKRLVPRRTMKGPLMQSDVKPKSWRALEPTRSTRNAGRHTRVRLIALPGLLTTRVAFKD
jgi:hypothetical protein